jgi:hypothetical protein
MVRKGRYVLAMLLFTEFVAFVAIASGVERLQYLRGKLTAGGWRLAATLNATLFLILVITVLSAAVRWAVTGRQPTPPPVSWLVVGGVIVAVAAVRLLFDMRRWRSRPHDLNIGSR